MGFYVHCGSEGEGVLLCEVGTREVVSCTVPAGYAGGEGEIWFVRVLPPPHSLCRRHIVFTTPYVIRDSPERAFIDYLERELARMKAKKPPRTEDAHGHLMKYGPGPNHWNEYILCAYSGHQAEAIFLTGIPDIRESLPPWLNLSITRTGEPARRPEFRSDGGRLRGQAVEDRADKHLKSPSTQGSGRNASSDLL